MINKKWPDNGGIDQMSPSDSTTIDKERLIFLIREIAQAGSEGLQHALPELMRICKKTLLHLRRSAPRFSTSEWPWLSGTEPDTLTMQDGNRFLFACILELNAGKTDVWANTEYFVNEVLEEPENLWHGILLHSPQGWADQFWEYDLHPEPALHTRLYDVASLMVRYYHGDARQIWSDYLSSPQEVFRRIKVLGVPRSTACLITGALKDEQYLEGIFDIVGDVVDSRVLGRIACGEGNGLTSYQTRILGKMIAAEDPWILDRPLYVLGMSYCGPGPRCRRCPVHEQCVYAVSVDLGISVGKKIYEGLFGQKTVQKSLKRWL
ncbi:hypothetical protein [uncultured Methanospirillum sp.]|uniref:hypothetical protein n=1 Tax=uncultured Methanospirillum sp. TaxID=262503 RepID=UPI0029C89756|nr:hypothetical protein [uncultured Methanospirillum sp.]